MKRLKRIASIVLAMVMVLGMSLTAFATGPQTGDPTGGGDGSNGKYTITINGKTAEREYKAYQVFKGDVDTKNNQTTLSNIRWGDDVDTEGNVAVHTNNCYDKDGKLTCTDASSHTYTLMGALAANFTEEGKKIDADMNVARVAEIMASADFSAADAEKFADIISYFIKADASGKASSVKAGETTVYEIKDVEPGYYFIKETGDLPVDDSQRPLATQSDYILQVVGPTSVTTKDTTIVYDKEIVEGETEVKENTAGIGDNVTYKITADVPDYTGYDYFYFIMNDTLQDGLTFNNDVEVKIGETTLTRGDSTESANDKYHVYGVSGSDTAETTTLLTASSDTAEVKKIRIAFDNIMHYTKGSKIVITYSAKVNGDANIGENGNTNTVDITYPPSPNFKWDGTQDNTKPGLPDSTKYVPTVETPEKKVVTFVTQLEIYKTQNNKAAALPGAEFTLTGYSTETVLEGGWVYTPDPAGGYYQLKTAIDGEYYTETEPTVEATMQPLPANAKAGYVEEENTYTGTDRIVVGGKVYRPYKEAADSLKQVYILVEPNSDRYVSVTAKFKREKAVTNTKTTKYVQMRATSDADGKIVFSGLGEGIYTITETNTPDGFNTADPITIEIKGSINWMAGENVVTGKETYTWVGNESIGLEVRTLTDNKHNDNVVDEYYLPIDNKRGSLLPSTGGIGTTIFYVVGGILVIGAGILLVTKKRMSRN